LTLESVRVEEVSLSEAGEDVADCCGDAERGIVSVWAAWILQGHNHLRETHASIPS
jgi:hypothetical protein